jgi:subtilisin family serine protease
VLASGNYATGVGDLGTENYGNLDAVVVGATDRSGNVPSYSSAPGNAKWGLVAPGGSGTGGADNNVISTFPLSTGGSGYASAAGTSMAAPHVSGAVALLLAQGLSPVAAVNRLLATVDKSSPCGRGCQGRLNVAAAVGADATPATAVAAAPATVPRTTVPKVTTTTRPKVTAPAPSTTSSTEPPRSVQAADPSQVALPLPLAGSRGLSSSSSRNPLVPAAAASLVVVVGASVGGVGLRRLRAA